VAGNCVGYYLITRILWTSHEEFVVNIRDKVVG